MSPLIQLPPRMTTKSQMSPSSSLDENIDVTDRHIKKKNSKKKKKPPGVYVRPSGAIERGSGFFVPGLEGPRVRLVIGTILLGLTMINHIWLLQLLHGNMVQSNSSMDPSFSFQETIAIGYSFLILFQSGIEFVKEQRRQYSVDMSSSSNSSIRNSSSSISNVGTNDSTSPVLQQKWATTTTLTTTTKNTEQVMSYRSKIAWAAIAYMSMTPTQEIMLLTRSSTNNDGNENHHSMNQGIILYRLGQEEEDDDDGQPSRSGGGVTTTSDPTKISTGVQAALQELQQSKGGRISLPMTHPAVQALLVTSSHNNNNNQPRTVILQRITDHQCWMIVSDQLLASYTLMDLKWLGQMAAYIAQ
jgi:hypothetical protein